MNNSDHASQISIAAFVKTKFIPDHVTQKTLAGRTHYYSILKHVLRPEAVDRVTGQISTTANTRLRSVPSWPYLDDVKLCDLTPDHVRQLMSAAFIQGYSAQTVKHIRNVIGAIVSHAIREGCLNGKNLVFEVTLPPIVRKRTHSLTVPQVKSVLGLMRFPEREITLITIATEMSVSEICALQWKHVNLTKTAVEIDGEGIQPRSILVKQLWNRGNLVAPGPHRVRLVRIPDALVGVLLGLRRRLPSTVSDEFVLTSSSGKAISPVAALEMLLKPIGRTLDIPWLSWQVLRRAHGSLLAELRPRLCDDLFISLQPVRTWDHGVSKT